MKLLVNQATQGRRPLRGLMDLFGLFTWDSAALHPRLYAADHFADCRHYFSGQVNLQKPDALHAVRSLARFCNRFAYNGNFAVNSATLRLTVSRTSSDSGS